VPSALIIDDSAAFRSSARMLLESDGYEVTEAATGGAGVEAAAERRHDLVLLDIQLPDLDGFEVAERLARLESPPSVVLTSSRDGRDYGSLVETSSAAGFVAKSELSPAAIRALLPQRG
jgi:CheY-like chemotaxis protein